MNNELQVYAIKNADVVNLFENGDGHILELAPDNIVFILDGFSFYKSDDIWYSTSFFYNVALESILESLGVNFDLIDPPDDDYTTDSYHYSTDNSLDMKELNSIELSMLSQIERRLGM